MATILKKNIKKKILKNNKMAVQKLNENGIIYICLNRKFWDRSAGVVDPKQFMRSRIQYFQSESGYRSNFFADPDLRNCRNKLIP